MYFLFAASQRVVRVSSIYWDVGGAGDDREWIAPDVPVALGVSDLLAGRDPVLEAAIDLD